MKDVQNRTSTVSSRRILLHDCGPEILQLATNYASDYLGYLENLPFDLQRNITKLRKVDLKCRETVKEIEQIYENFMKENGEATTVRRRPYLLQIRRLFGICKELGDEKISIVQSISEVIESKNKQLEYECKRFEYAYEPSIKSEHGGKKEKESKSDSTRGQKRSRRQRNNNSSENKEKSSQNKDQEKASKSALHDDTAEPPSKIAATSPSPQHDTPTPVPVPALTRAALREEDKRTTTNRLKDKKDDKDDDQASNAGNSASGKNSTDTASSTSASATQTASVTTSAAKNKNGGTITTTTSSLSAGKATTKGKKKKRKSNKAEKQTGDNSGEVSPLVDVPIDPDEPTYCLCQQVSFGQMIGCDNPKCPIEWFHFSCVRLTHKPKGKWYCPDCAIKRKREGKKSGQ